MLAEGNRKLAEAMSFDQSAICDPDRAAGSQIPIEIRYKILRAPGPGRERLLSLQVSSDDVRSGVG